ncbi:hypothetical protein GZ77_07260 [Endozoicomonas montiporae]|uniref:Uncharacterized protein n=1 Tax=Endozoicomonas montiporae TaxID=1027273 RepID=A0A081N6Z2_9GAMM|nr:hypothetical protein GZ77_07260 [Endozoicomonas montiporae]
MVGISSQESRQSLQGYRRLIVFPVMVKEDPGIVIEVTIQHWLRIAEGKCGDIAHFRVMG